MLSFPQFQSFLLHIYTSILSSLLYLSQSYHLMNMSYRQDLFKKFLEQIRLYYLIVNLSFDQFNFRGVRHLHYFQPLITRCQIISHLLLPSLSDLHRSQFFKLNQRHLLQLILQPDFQRKYGPLRLFYGFQILTFLFPPHLFFTFLQLVRVIFLLLYPFLHKFRTVTIFFALSLIYLLLIHLNQFVR